MVLYYLFKSKQVNGLIIFTLKQSNYKKKVLLLVVVLKKRSQSQIRKKSYWIWSWSHLRETQNVMDPLDPDPKYCFLGEADDDTSQLIIFPCQFPKLFDQSESVFLLFVVSSF
jgi:hypothetical protein